MIPEIKLLHETFSGQSWNNTTQEQFIDKLAQSDFFEGKGSHADKAFSARDRINRAPKALGFINLNPHIDLTEAGNAFVYGKRPQEVFLRQLLKFQLPSPYHTENEKIKGAFYIRPYLEILRLVRELKYITFDEFKIFAVQMTNYHKFEIIKNAILHFREEKAKNKGQYKRFVNDEWENAILEIYSDRIASGKTKTRETNDASLKKFIITQKNNMRDYADACFRYMRYTGLISISHKNRSISIFADKVIEVDFILSTVPRDPVFIDDVDAYKAYLFSANTPALYTDNKDNIVDVLMQIGSFTRRELYDKTLEELKDLRDEIVQKHKDAVIYEQVTEIKSYALYSEIIDTFNEIISNGYYDAPLMFEYNTWRAMTMLDGGAIKGNFNFDDAGQPLSTAAGNMPDIECDYKDFSLSVEVTLQAGQRQYESEGEPVARHYGQLKKKTGKDTYCLFIAPTINPATLAHFYTLNHLSISLYGGKSKIIPLELAQFMQLIENSYNCKTQPLPSDIHRFLDCAIKLCEKATDENHWRYGIQACVDMWLAS
ncbi:MAG: AlwI family type II restriction endonuclease [Clostridium sp.]|nr:AlwI family type II restriction endonuclease [Clostridium sp.]